MAHCLESAYVDVLLSNNSSLRSAEPLQAPQDFLDVLKAFSTRVPRELDAIIISLCVGKSAFGMSFSRAASKQLVFATLELV